MFLFTCSFIVLLLAVKMKLKTEQSEAQLKVLQKNLKDRVKHLLKMMVNT